jgi:hypothetical protein
MVLPEQEPFSNRLARVRDVQHEGVNVEVSIEGSPQPLDHGHRAPTTVHDAIVARAGAQAPERPFSAIPRRV